MGQSGYERAIGRTADGSWWLRHGQGSSGETVAGLHGESRKDLPKRVVKKEASAVIAAAGGWFRCKNGVLSGFWPKPNGWRSVVYKY